jgi:hypothetical protein
MRCTFGLVDSRGMSLGALPFFPGPATSSPGHKTPSCKPGAPAPGTTPRERSTSAPQRRTPTPGRSSVPPPARTITQRPEEPNSAREIDHSVKEDDHSAKEDNYSAGEDDYSGTEDGYSGTEDDYSGKEEDYSETAFASRRRKVGSSQGHASQPVKRVAEARNFARTMILTGRTHSAVRGTTHPLPTEPSVAGFEKGHSHEY